jgi:hypothetical protein
MRNMARNFVIISRRAFVAGVMMASSVFAEIQDVRDDIATQTKHYRAQRFVNGQMPPKHEWRHGRHLLQEQTGAPVPGGSGYGYDFYNTSLNPTNWGNVGSALLGSNTVLSITNAIGADSQRFYRVLQQ